MHFPEGRDFPCRVLVVMGEVMVDVLLHPSDGIAQPLEVLAGNGGVEMISSGFLEPGELADICTRLERQPPIPM